MGNNSIKYRLLSLECILIKLEILAGELKTPKLISHVAIRKTRLMDININKYINTLSLRLSMFFLLLFIQNFQV